MDQTRIFGSRVLVTRDMTTLLQDLGLIKMFYRITGEIQLSDTRAAGEDKSKPNFKYLELPGLGRIYTIVLSQKNESKEDTEKRAWPRLRNVFNICSDMKTTCIIYLDSCYMMVKDHISALDRFPIISWTPKNRTDYISSGKVFNDMLESLHYMQTFVEQQKKIESVNARFQKRQQKEKKQQKHQKDTESDEEVDAQDSEDTKHVKNTAKPKQEDKSAESDDVEGDTQESSDEKPEKSKPAAVAIAKPRRGGQAPTRRPAMNKSAEGRAKKSAEIVLKSSQEEDNEEAAAVPIVHNAE
jgi:hypothetical protein